MSEHDCTWCDAYLHATETLGYSDDGAANYATIYEHNASKSK